MYMYVSLVFIIQKLLPILSLYVNGIAIRELSLSNKSLFCISLTDKGKCEVIQYKYRVYKQSIQACVEYA